MSLFNLKNISTFFFFSFFIFIGLGIFKDYGMSWDEVMSRNNGIVSLNYLATIFDISMIEHFGNIIPLHQYRDQDYGVVFELPMAFIEYIFDIKDSHNIFYLRHFFTYLFFIFGTYSIYEMSYRRFKNWKIGLFSSLIFILSPRFFAEAFYNSKDIVFMSAFAIATNYNIKFLLKPTTKNTLLSTFFTALAIDIRIMGIIIPTVTFFIFIIKSVKDKHFFKKKYFYILFYLILLATFIILMWPWLWSDPIGNFLLAFENMSKFRWDGSVLFFGDYIKATELPWYYALVWMAITTPPLYIILFLIGSLKIMHNLIVNNYKFWDSSEEMQDYIFFGLFIGPLLAVIILHSVLYDGWRQLYFIYPMFILLATHGIVFIWNMNLIKYTRKTFSLILIASLIQIIITMWSMHPLQNVYFNFLAGKNLKANWDLDYWGLGNLKALKYILKNDKRTNITIYKLSSTPIQKSFKMLTPKEQNRIKISSSKESSDYLLNNFRSVRNNDLLEASIKDTFLNYYSIKYGNEIILKVYKSK